MLTDPLLSSAVPKPANQRYWRNLAELAGKLDFEEFVRREFPRQAAALGASLNRRDFLKLMGAALALAGLQACTPAPAEKIVPYVRQPEQLIPGRPLFFATAMTLGGYACGLLVESHEGRPTKVEGNPNHPDSLGATDAYAQASVLELYDPDRASGIKQAGQARTWNDFLAALGAGLTAQRGKQGAGLRILTETVTSPTLADQLTRILSAFPQARWHSYEPLTSTNMSDGTRLAFGVDADVLYHFQQADVVLSLNSDFMAALPASLRYARDFSARRMVTDAASASRLNRLYAVESTPSVTGSVADEHLPLTTAGITALAYALAARLGVTTGQAPAAPVPARWLDALVADLQAHRGTSLIIAGDAQPPAVHALVHALNQSLGNVGRTLTYTAPVAANPQNQLQSLGDLVSGMQAGQVELLLMLGGNPAYNAPADLAFGTQLLKVPFSVHLSLYDDETSAQSTWHVPAAHFLEAWGDARASDGTASIIQPLILPLHGGRSAHEVLDVLLNPQPRSDHDVVKAYWQSHSPAGDFETFWRKALHDGVIPGTASAALTPTLNAGALGALPPPPAPAELELLFRPDPSIYDGRFANNAWLQELPKSITKLTWDNAVLLSPGTAQRLGLANAIASEGGERGQVMADVVELSLGQRSLQVPIWVVPGQPDGTLTLHLGYGRTRAGSVGTGLGVNAGLLRTSQSLWVAPGVTLRKLDRRVPLATTQFDQLMEGRDLVRAATAQAFAVRPDFAHDDGPAPDDSLYPPVPYTGYKWGMLVDHNVCIGCNACVIACQAENNIPSVGKAEVLNARSMHWLRIDRYHTGDPANPMVYHQPVPCMHCENAPCEPVCPVAATTHSSEGLNEMTYNRCVGTRYCSNNCPYKVRRFNFLQYQDWNSEPLRLLSNPDVTVRSRGVMEKCTYCVQRINVARIAAEKEGRRIRDGEVIPACAAACPSGAIIFGDMNDANSAVMKSKSNTRNYALLGELNTRPRTTYLAAVRNPNPDISAG